jgi:hypothetical protein
MTSNAEFENYVFSRGGNRLIRTILIASNGRRFLHFIHFIFLFSFVQTVRSFDTHAHTKELLLRARARVRL